MLYSKQCFYTIYITLQIFGDCVQICQKNCIYPVIYGSSIPKVQVKPGRKIDPNQDDMAANYLSRLPVLKEQAAPYVPMPYVFRVNAACNRIKIQNMWGRCPPFHLLFDHTIAVIWLLFAEKEYDCPLGTIISIINLFRYGILQLYLVQIEIIFRHI